MLGISSSSNYTHSRDVRLQFHISVIPALALTGGKQDAAKGKQEGPLRYGKRGRGRLFHIARLRSARGARAAAGGRAPRKP